MQKQNKKLFNRKYILAAVVLLLLVTSALVYIYFTQEQKPDPASEALIRQATARRLSKDPNDLTYEDFAKIRVLHFAELQQGPNELWTITHKYRELSEITLLDKFKNLEKLSLQNIHLKENFPQWIKFLAKFGFHLKNKVSIDLYPLAKLSKLQVLDLHGFPAQSIEPLSKLTNLKMLDISETSVSDIEPLKNLTNLEYVLMLGCKNITDKQVEDLKKALPKLKIEYIQIMPKDRPYVFKAPIRPMLEIKDFQPEAESITPDEK